MSSLKKEGTVLNTSQEANRYTLYGESYQPGLGYLVRFVTTNILVVMK